MFNECESVFNEFVKKIKKVKKYNSYKYFFGKNNGLELKKFSEVKGPFLTDGFDWPFELAEVWFKGEIVIPEQVVGILIKDAAAILAFRTLCSSALFINGKRKVDAKWWIDTDINLSDSLEGREKFDITISYRKIEGCKLLELPRILIDKVESAFQRIDVFFKTLKFLKRLINLGKIKDKRLIDILESIIRCIPIGLLRDEKPLEFINYIKETEVKLQPFSPYLKKYCSYLIGHAHIDMNWFWNWEETLDTAKRTFIQVGKFMDQYPDFCFSQSQTVLYKAMEDNYPEVFTSIKKMIKEGRWDVTASTWVEGNLNMASGEALIRQSLYAKEYTRRKFGVESRVCWCPDTFGHPASYPQILKKCGIDYYYFCRCGKSQPIFYWEGIDGSQILTFNDPKGYNGVITADLISRFDRSMSKPCSLGGFVDSMGDFNIKKHLFSYGVGDHGGGPTRRDIENGLALKDKDVFSGVRFSTAHKFFNDVEKAAKDIPVIKDELNYIFEGCYTTHADIKKYNRECENLLVTAEIFSSLASLFGFNYPAANLKKAWQDTCFNQFHDIFPGSAIHSSYDYSGQLAEEAIAVAKETIDNATQYISSLISFSPRSEAVPVVVFNSLAWTRDDVAEVNLTKLGGDYLVKDSSGKEIPSQIFDDRLFFSAEQIPSFGYKTYFLYKRDKRMPPSPAEPVSKQERIFENERYLLEIDPLTGGIKRLFNKAKHKELIDNFQQGNIFKLYTEQEHGMSAWNIGPIDSVKNLLRHTKIIKTTKGTLIDIIETECKFAKSRINQEIMFFKAQDKIEFRTKLLWNETGTPKKGVPMLRISFPLGIISTTAVYEIPFGAIKRPNTGQEAPALKWLDYSDGKFGVALLNDCKYGHNVQGNNIELTIIRSSYEPDLNPDCGEHLFSYYLYPHEGNWQNAEVAKRGYEVNMPLLPVVMDKDSLSSKDKFLPLEKAFVKVNADNIIISCLKKAEDTQGFIMHAYESQGKSVNVNFDFGLNIKRVAETDLIEKTVSSCRMENYLKGNFPYDSTQRNDERSESTCELASNKLKDKFKKWEIKSYRLTC